ncbi:Dehydrin family protein [Euphorbia peplus]|nr:Dehydrin family protein [Euphorbia peplus]
MAESTNQHEHDIPVTGGEDAGVETTDRGLFDFLGKKEETKPQEEVIASEFEQKVQVSEPEHKEAEKKPSIMEKLHRSDSSSSSSSDEEDDEEKKKKKKEKKGLKEKLKEKISGEKPEENKHWELETNTAAVEVKKHEEDNLPGQTEMAPAPVPEEKKGFLEKIKDKLPGQTKKVEEVPVSSTPPPPPPVAEHVATETHETEPKKGFLEKIKEKLPGYHSKTEEEKEKEKTSD